MYAQLIFGVLQDVDISLLCQSIVQIAFCVCLNCGVLLKPVYKESYRPELDVLFMKSNFLVLTVTIVLRVLLLCWKYISSFCSILSSLYYCERLPILRYPIEFSINCMSGCGRNQNAAHRRMKKMTGMQSKRS